MLFIDPNRGTGVVGSLYGVLHTLPRDLFQDEYPHTTDCRIEYDPQRPGSTDLESWWVIGYVPEGIIDLGRWWVQKRFGITLERPSYPAHISIVRGEQPVHEEHWKAHQGSTIQVQYTQAVYTNGGHWWLNVDASAPLEDIRIGLGFPSGGRSYHITLGRTPLGSKKRAR